MALGSLFHWSSFSIESRAFPPGIREDPCLVPLASARSVPGTEGMVLGEGKRTLILAKARWRGVFVAVVTSSAQMSGKSHVDDRRSASGLRFSHLKQISSGLDK